jgi:hypothetical protein
MGWAMRVAIITGSLDGRGVVDASGEQPDAFFEKPSELERVLRWISGETKSP